MVPSGLPDDPPVRDRPVLRGVVPGIAASDKLLLWGGGIYNWLDPLTLLSALDRLRHRLPEVRLCFLGLSHPSPAAATMAMATRAVELAGRLGLTATHVFFQRGVGRLRGAPGLPAQAMRPLLEFCRAPWRAPDLVRPSARASRSVPSTSEIGGPGLPGALPRLLHHLRRGEVGVVADRALGRLRRLSRR